MSGDRLRIPEFYKLSVEERVRAVHERGLINTADFRALATGKHTLDLDAADKMIENVVGVMGLPLGLGMNLLVNGQHYVVPMVVEEPSVVAALGSACKLVRSCGGFKRRSDGPDPDRPDPDREPAATWRRRSRRCATASRRSSTSRTACTRTWSRAAAAPATSSCSCIRCRRARKQMLVVHLLVDTRDAMGANLVNGMCEGVAPLVESITGGEVFLRILSNLTDRALVRAHCKIPVEQLAGKGYTGEQARDGIIVAAEFAAVDPYRAATHNKGIMNGIDPVAIATGNDWRAIEAGAHAYAARGGRYSSLTDWWADEEGNLCGRIEMPIKVGIVGAPLESNPTVALNLRLLGVEVGDGARAGHGGRAASRRTSRRCARSRPKASRRAT